MKNRSLSMLSFLATSVTLLTITNTLTTTNGFLLPTSVSIIQQPTTTPTEIPTTNNNINNKPSSIASYPQSYSKSAFPNLVLFGKRGNGKVGKKKNEKRVKKENLPEKICVVCGRPFTWRKKWERSWDEVTCCSKSCNAKRRSGDY